MWCVMSFWLNFWMRRLRCFFFFFLPRFAFEFPISLLPLLLYTLPCVHSNLIWLWNRRLDPKTRGREKDRKHQQGIGENENLTVEPIRKIHSVYACWLFISLCTRRKTSAVRMSYNVLSVLSLFAFFAATFFDVFYSLLIRLMVKRNGFRMWCQRIIHFQDIVCKHGWRVRGKASLGDPIFKWILRECNLVSFSTISNAALHSSEKNCEIPLRTELWSIFGVCFPGTTTKRVKGVCMAGSDNLHSFLVLRDYFLENCIPYFLHAPLLAVI